MNSTEISRILEELIGQAPEGLEWLAYFGAWLLVVGAVVFICMFIFKLFKLFDR